MYFNVEVQLDLSLVYLLSSHLFQLEEARISSFSATAVAVSTSIAPH